jgi:hypothetical protein
MIFDGKRAALAAVMLFLFLAIPGFTQDTSFETRVRKAYGLDQDLVNGIQYYNHYMRVQGHPYLLEKSFANGSVTIDGQVHDQIQLMYDIYAQKVEIQYKMLSSANNRMILITDHLDGFICGDLLFQKLKLNAEQDLIYQVVPNDGFTCYIHWKKKIVPLKYSTNYLEQFTDPDPTYFIEMDGNVVDFKNRRSFAGCFTGTYQKEIRKLLRQNEFSFRRATPDEIVRNMEAVSSLIGSNAGT